MEKYLYPVGSLTDVPYPKCVSSCKHAERFGESECKGICLHKFETETEKGCTGCGKGNYGDTLCPECRKREGW